MRRGGTGDPHQSRCHGHWPVLNDARLQHGVNVCSKVVRVAATARSRLRRTADIVPRRYGSGRGQVATTSEEVFYIWHFHEPDHWMADSHGGSEATLSCHQPCAPSCRRFPTAPTSPQISIHPPRMDDHSALRTGSSSTSTSFSTAKLSPSNSARGTPRGSSTGRKNPGPHDHRNVSYLKSNRLDRPSRGGISHPFGD